MSCADRLLAVEVKSDQTVIGDFFKGFIPFENALKWRTLGKALIYGGERREFFFLGYRSILCSLTVFLISKLQYQESQDISDKFP